MAHVWQKTEDVTDFKEDLITCSSACESEFVKSHLQLKYEYLDVFESHVKNFLNDELWRESQANAKVKSVLKKHRKIAEERLSWKRSCFSNIVEKEISRVFPMSSKMHNIKNQYKDSNGLSSNFSKVSSCNSSVSLKPTKNEFDNSFNDLLQQQINLIQEIKRVKLK